MAKEGETMSEKRKIDDADLTEIAGSGELVAGAEELKQAVPSPPGGGGANPPETDDQGGGNQNFGN